MKSYIPFVLSLTVAGCFTSEVHNGRIQCGPNASCPPGMVCNPADNRCYAKGQIPPGSGGVPGADMSAGDGGGPSMPDGGTPTLDCPKGTHQCGDRCAANNDPNSCNMSCTPCQAPVGGTATCDGTQCGGACPPNLKLCAGACIGLNESCNGVCPPGTHNCNNLCLSDADVNSCGSLCIPCAAPAHSKASCDPNHQCAFTCDPGYLPMGEACVFDSTLTNEPCTAPNTTRPCYSGPPGTQNVPECRSGSQVCDARGYWAKACLGEVDPQPERCNGKDDDCDGTVDDGCPRDGAPLGRNTSVATEKSATYGASAGAVFSFAESGNKVIVGFAGGSVSPLPVLGGSLANWHVKAVPASQPNQDYTYRVLPEAAMAVGPFGEGMTTEAMCPAGAVVSSLTPYLDKAGSLCGFTFSCANYSLYGVPGYFLLRNSWAGNDKTVGNVTGCAAAPAFRCRSGGPLVQVSGHIAAPPTDPDPKQDMGTPAPKPTGIGISAECADGWMVQTR